MPFTDEIFKRATIRGYAEYLLYNDTVEEEKRDYETRMKDAYKIFDDWVEKYGIKPSSSLIDKVNELISEMVDVYTEIGIQAGILIMFDIMKNINFNQNSTKDNDCEEKYKKMYVLLFRAISSALTELQNKNLDSIDKAESILKKVQSKTENIFIDSE